MKVAFNKGHLKHISGDIDKLPAGDFANLFNVVLYEKARREMESMKPSCKHTVHWRLTIEGSGDKVVEPTTIDFKRTGLRTEEYFPV